MYFRRLLIPLTLSCVLLIGCNTSPIPTEPECICPPCELEHVPKNPTYEKMRTFLKENPLTRKYSKGKYECTEAVRDIKKNANARGIRCAAIFLDLKSHEGDPVGGHVMTLFETTNGGPIYVDVEWDSELDTFKRYFERSPKGDRLTCLIDGKTVEYIIVRRVAIW